MSSYNRTIWQDSPETEITAERLNAMEEGIEQAHDGENVPDFESYDTQNPEQELVVPPIVKGDKLKDILSKLTQFCNNIRFLMGKDYIVEQGDNYVKYSSGKLMQWGRNASTVSNATGEVVPISFYVEFADIEFRFLTSASTNGTLLTYPLVEGDSGGNSKRTVNGTAVYVRKTQSPYAVSFDWLAIGKWY